MPIKRYATSMQDVRSSNPYIKRVQYLGEINRLKRITIFLRTVQTLCDLTSSEKRWQRYELARDHGNDAEEKVFIEDTRLRLRAVAAARRYPEIVDDLLCRYLIDYAERASDRRIPLVGDLNRLKDIAKMYHDGGIKDVTTALFVGYVNNPTPGQASEGTNILVSLTQRNTIKVISSKMELRKKVKTALSSLPKPANKQDQTRKDFLNTTVRTALEKAKVDGWYCNYIEANAADYAILEDSSLSPLDSVFPSATENHGGYYEQSFLWMAINELSDDQKQALGKFLRPKDYDGNLSNTVYKADSEDVYRVLTYLKRLNKK